MAFSYSRIQKANQLDYSFFPFIVLIMIHCFRNTCNIFNIIFLFNYFPSCFFFFFFLSKSYFPRSLLSVYSKQNSEISTTKYKEKKKARFPFSTIYVCTYKVHTQYVLHIPEEPFSSETRTRILFLSQIRIREEIIE